MTNSVKTVRVHLHATVLEGDAPQFASDLREMMSTTDVAAVDILITEDHPKDIEERMKETLCPEKM